MKRKRLSQALCLTFAILTSEAVMAVNHEDTTITQLRDVEIVGLKQMPDKEREVTTTIDASLVSRLNLTTVRNVSEVTPNFYIPAYGSRMTSSIYVRGLGSRIDAPVVGMNVDNVPILNKDNFDFDLVDVDRIEILRGTQALLNGRNSAGGQINIFTLSPWAFDGLRFVAEYGRKNTARVSAAWYGRLSDKTATSVAGWFGTTDGFYRNTYDNSHCGSERQGGGRWKLSWHPGSRWSLANTAMLNVGKQNGYPYASVDDGTINYGDDTYYRRTSFSDGLTVSYNGNRMIATSITSLQYLNDNMTLDQDFRPEDYFTLTQRRKEIAFTQDLFAKGRRGQYDWLMGASGFYRSTDMSAPVTFKNYGIEQLIENNVNRVLPSGMKLLWDERQMLLGDDFDIANGGFALYHQSAVHFGRFILRAGLRWDIEKTTLDYHSLVNTSCTMYRTLPTGAMIPLQKREITIDNADCLSQTFNQLLPRLSVTFDAGRGWNIFASAAKGYKAGGYNTQMFSDILQQQLMEQMGLPAAYDIESMITYKPEKLWTYEVGTDATICGGMLDLEAVAYLMNVKDQQLTIFPEGQTTGRAMTNAGRTRSLGAELSMTWHTQCGLTLNAAYGYTHAKFTSYNNGRQDMTGNRLPYAPAHTMFIGAHYDIPVKFGDFTPVIDITTRGAGDIWWNDANTVKQNFYATLGASLGVTHPKGSLTLWGENLTNTKYDTFYFESVGNKFVQRARPWSIGVTLRVNLPKQ